MKLAFLLFTTPAICIFDLSDEGHDERETMVRPLHRSSNSLVVGCFFFSSSDSRLVLLVVALAIARVPAIFVYYFAGTVN
jgi:hypothetical protein